MDNRHGCAHRGAALVLTPFPLGIPMRHTDTARAISRGLGMRLVQKKDTLRDIATASNCAQGRRTVEPPVDPSPAVSAERTRHIAPVLSSIRPDKLPDLCQAKRSGGEV